MDWKQNGISLSLAMEKAPVMALVAQSNDLWHVQVFKPQLVATFSQLVRCINGPLLIFQEWCFSLSLQMLFLRMLQEMTGLQDLLQHKQFQALAHTTVFSGFWS